MLIDIIHNYDEIATLAINHLQFPYSDQFWMFMSNNYVWIPFYVLLLLSMWKNIGLRRMLIFGTMTTLAFICCENTANLFKDGVQRLRPCYDEFMLNGSLNILEGRGGMFGFFSAHAANAMAVAIVTIYAFGTDEKKKHHALNIIMILWALLVSVSRIFVGKHFLGDVLTGLAIGSFYGLLFGNIGRWLSVKVEEKFRSRQATQPVADSVQAKPTL